MRLTVLGSGAPGFFLDCGSGLYNIFYTIDKVTTLMTKLDKPKVLTTPAGVETKNNKTKLSVLIKTAGLWSKRKDIKDSNSWVSTLRGKESSRVSIL